jgi:hypothetical protein
MKSPIACSQYDVVWFDLLKIGPVSKSVVLNPVSLVFVLGRLISDPVFYRE